MTGATRHRALGTEEGHRIAMCLALPPARRGPRGSEIRALLERGPSNLPMAAIPAPGKGVPPSGYSFPGTFCFSSSSQFVTKTMFDGTGKSSLKGVCIR